METYNFKIGLKLKKIHRVIKFNQSQWLKPYIELSTKKRIKAGNNNDKDGKALYKLMNNAMKEKTVANVRNRIDLKLVSNKKRVFKMCIKTKLHVAQNI